MRVVVITPPAPVVAWAEADAHLKLDGNTDQQAEVEAMVAAATAHIDGPTGWLGRAIGVQTLEARFDGFDCDLRLPFPPVSSVTSVKYLDGDGVEQTLAADLYDDFGGLLEPAFGGRWPTARRVREAVRVRYVAGYATLPHPIRAAILLMVGDLYRNRGEAVIGTISGQVAMSTTVTNLLAPFRVFA